MKIVDIIGKVIGKHFCEIACKKEYEQQKFGNINERPIEYLFVFEEITRIYPKTVLDVGSGTTSLPHLLRTCGFIVTAIDNVIDYWSKNMFNRHYYIINDDITHSKLNNKFDFVICVSVLEHIKNFNAAIKNMINLMNPNGYLILTFPYNENIYIENVYKLPNSSYGQNNPYICQIFSRNEINQWLKIYNIKIKKQEYWHMFTGEFWTFGKRIYPPIQVNREDKHQLTCILIQKQ